MNGQNWPCRERSWNMSDMCWISQNPDLPSQREGMFLSRKASMQSTEVTSKPQDACSPTMPGITFWCRKPGPRQRGFGRGRAWLHRYKVLALPPDKASFLVGFRSSAHIGVQLQKHKEDSNHIYLPKHPNFRATSKGTEYGKFCKIFASWFLSNWDLWKKMPLPEAIWILQPDSAWIREICSPPLPITATKWTGSDCVFHSTFNHAWMT